mgnify:CR=1 FL=1
MKHQNQSLRNLLLAAMFLAIGLVLPFFTGQIKEIGNMLETGISLCPAVSALLQAGPALRQISPSARRPAGRVFPLLDVLIRRQPPRTQHATDIF